MRRTFGKVHNDPETCFRCGRGKWAHRTDFLFCPVPEEGVDRCPCGCKYWTEDRCFDCGEKFRPELDTDESVR